jgi:hypothetical protein
MTEEVRGVHQGSGGSFPVISPEFYGELIGVLWGSVGALRRGIARFLHRRQGGRWRKGVQGAPSTRKRR